MKFHKLTHNDAGEDVALWSPEDWNEWVSATELRGHLLRETLSDWLDRYGEARGFVCDESRDDYDRNLDFLAFLFEQDRRFEEAVVSYCSHDRRRSP